MENISHSNDVYSGGAYEYYPNPDAYVHTNNYSDFQEVYHCSSLSSIKKQHLEEGDKVLLPASALNSLQYMEVEFPMLFEIRNPINDRISHCGVLEFTAEEGFINMRKCMMDNIYAEDGDCVLVRNVRLEKATYVKLQPHSKEFLNISNPKAVLEKALRNYTCMTTGDTIVFSYNEKKYFVDIVETKPNNAVSLYETDCEVDFAPPLDYVEPVKPVKAVPLEPVVEELDTKLASFTGVARRLDGKPCSAAIESSSSSTVGKSVQQPISRPGKLVFGSSDGAEARKLAPKTAEKGKAEDAKIKEEKKWQAFTGRSYSLKG